MKALGWWIIILAFIGIASRASTFWRDDKKAGEPSSVVQSQGAVAPVADDHVVALMESVANSQWSTTETQLCLKAVGFAVDVDGVRGPQTQAAAEAFAARQRHVNDRPNSEETSHRGLRREVAMLPEVS